MWSWLLSMTIGAPATTLCQDWRQSGVCRSANASFLPIDASHPWPGGSRRGPACRAGVLRGGRTVPLRHHRGSHSGNRGGKSSGESRGADRSEQPRHLQERPCAQEQDQASDHHHQQSVRYDLDQVAGERRTDEPAEHQRNHRREIAQSERDDEGSRGHDRDEKTRSD